jgi:hypothetical protein
MYVILVSFISVRPSQSGPMFASKAGAHLSEAPFKGSTLLDFIQGNKV